jgi:hypothetical protein
MKLNMNGQGQTKTESSAGKFSLQCAEVTSNNAFHYSEDVGNDQLA